jgi:diacylglycerol O-acyltransferase
MRRLAPADAWFLYLENPDVHLHVTGVIVVDPSTSSEPFTPEHLRDHLRKRLHLMGPLQRRLVTVPFGLDHPGYVVDPAIDLDAHCYEHHLDAPGGMDQLAEFIGAFASEQLDRSKPMWEMVLVTGLADGRAAIASKMHHAIVDGGSGVEFMGHLLDFTPETVDPIPPEPVRPEPMPTPLRSIATAAVGQLTDPGRRFRAVTRAAKSVSGMAGATIAGARRSSGSLARPFSAPRTPFNGSLTSAREVAFDTVPLDAVKGVKNAFDVTVNDVVLAACALGLRSYLLNEGAEADRPLVAAVPVSLHSDDNDSEATNQVSTMFVHLPVDEPDPAQVLRQVHASSTGAKEIHQASAGDLIGDMVDLIPPPVFEFLAGMWSKTKMSDRIPPVQNLIVSNVAGMPVPLYLAGAEIVGLYPFGPLMEGSGLNITVLSTGNHLDLGLISCTDLVPDLPMLRSAIVEAFERLDDMAHEVDSPGARRRRPGIDLTDPSRRRAAEAGRPRQPVR